MDENKLKSAINHFAESSGEILDAVKARKGERYAQNLSIVSRAMQGLEILSNLDGAPPEMLKFVSKTIKDQLATDIVIMGLEAAHHSDPRELPKAEVEEFSSHIMTLAKRYAEAAKAVGGVIIDTGGRHGSDN